MYIFILPLFFQMAEPHRWGDRDLDNKILKNVPHPVKHSQGFYKDGSSSGYFKDGQFRKDNGHTQQEYKFTGPIRNDAVMKQAEQNIQQSWEQKKYNPFTHNCRQYKNAVNREYNKIAPKYGYGPLNIHK